MFRDVVLKKIRNDDNLEPKVTYTAGITVAVDFDNDPSVASRPGFVWVRENGQDAAIFQCFNPAVKAVSNLPVIVSHYPKRPLRRIIVGVDWDKLYASSTQADTYNLINHHYSHEWPTMYPGSDALNVYIRSIVPFRVYPNQFGVRVTVAHSKYMYNGSIVQFLGTDWDMSDSVPLTADSFRVSLVYLNPSTNLVEVIDGTESLDPAPTYPDVPANMIPLAYIRLYTGMTAISESDIVEDGRLLFSFSDPISTLISTQVNNLLAYVEAEWDYVMTRHAVEG